jgi:hypothetical protein
MPLYTWPTVNLAAGGAADNHFLRRLALAIAQTVGKKEAPPSEAGLHRSFDASEPGRAVSVRTTRRPGLSTPVPFEIRPSQLDGVTRRRVPASHPSSRREASAKLTSGEPQRRPHGSRSASVSPRAISSSPNATLGPATAHGDLSTRHAPAAPHDVSALARGNR